jgi:hypothetical protein
MALGAGLALSGLFVAGASADISGNENYASQVGLQTSTSTQSSAALSGSATAADDAVATSGDVTLSTLFQGGQVLAMEQANQSDMGAGVDITGNFNGTVEVPTLQSGTNALINGQNNMGGSGNADCTDAATCTTGPVSSDLSNIQTQLQELLQSNQSAFPPPPPPPAP